MNSDVEPVWTDFTAGNDIPEDCVEVGWSDAVRVFHSGAYLPGKTAPVTNI